MLVCFPELYRTVEEECFHLETFMVLCSGIFYPHGGRLWDYVAFIVVFRVWELGTPELGRGNLGIWVTQSLESGGGKNGEVRGEEEEGEES